MVPFGDIAIRGSFAVLEADLAWNSNRKRCDTTWAG